jgi:Txe/YoeB family toxin of toxin-antitoxin system
MRIVFSKRFRKEIEKAKHTYLISKIKELIAIVKKNPFQKPPPYEKLHGYPNAYSRRINEQHRLVYIVSGDTVEFTCCWGHYE